MHDHTLEVHGAHAYDSTGAISQPIYLSSTFRHPGFGKSTGYDYGRVGNPTRDALEKTIARLEKGDRSWAVSSGMAAINLVLILFDPGDHVLLSEDLYGGTVRLANEIYGHYGIDFEYVDTTDLALLESRVRPNTRAIFIETPSNPMMFITDIAAVSEIAHKAGAFLVVDNTFLSPHFQKPLTLGADMVVHSGTKYLCGHNDVIAGFLVVKDGSSKEAQRLEMLVKSEGPNMSSMDAWLMLRSLKTLGIRVERQAQTALSIAHWLREHPQVTEVHYPGLPDSPGYEVQKKQASGNGGMLSFKVTSAELAKSMLERLKLIAFAESLGGVESLLTYPIAQTHAEMPKELLARTGLDDKLLRFSVGLEDKEDLIEDLKQALEV